MVAAARDCGSRRRGALKGRGRRKILRFVLLRKWPAEINGGNQEWREYGGIQTCVDLCLCMK
jgi:hypothetical protein